MDLTLGQQTALDGFTKGENILLLGDPGTGKSTLISEMMNYAKMNDLNMAMTASTGIAAQMIGGRTIHSLLKAYPKMDYSVIDYKNKVKGFEDVDILVIDEISMMGKSFVDYLVNCINAVNHPIQLVLAGDFFQLPPVKDGFAFESPKWGDLRLNKYELTEVVRQEDAEFKHYLKMLKYGDDRCLNYLLKHSSPNYFAGQISICAKRDDANRINNEEFEKLDGLTKIYCAEHFGTIDENDLRMKELLMLKEGMRVMSVSNGDGYSNGSIGTVISMEDDGVAVRFDNNNICYLTKTKTCASRTDKLGEETDFWQIPLLPAYAITIHKSQGQTFDYVNIDGRKCWAPGQLYVAVSRARSIEGIHFMTPIAADNVRSDPRVLNFYKETENRKNL